jgi:hypothetical protein
VVPKANCILHRRALSGDVVSFKNKFQLRNVTRDHLAQQMGATYLAQSGYQNIEHGNNAETRATLLETKNKDNLIVYRIREDLSWKDVSRDFPAAQHVLNGLSIIYFIIL